MTYEPGSAGSYRARAAELRLLAAQTKDVKIRKSLRDIAKDYERMANAVDALLAHAMRNLIPR